MLGGTYDPIHYGHIRLAEMYAEKLDLDKIFIIPTKTPPHKKASETPEEHRFAMCRLAVQSLDDRFEVSDFEITREGKSYSFYTVSHLREQFPGCRFFLTVGADMFMTMETWYRFDELKDMVTICGVPRADISIEQLREHAAELEDMGCSCFVTEFEPVPLSSTLLRQRIADGESITGMTPPAVEQYIYENGLYRNAADPSDDAQ